MPRAFLVKKCTHNVGRDVDPLETTDSSFDSGCERSERWDDIEEIDVVGDSECHQDISPLSQDLYSPRRPDVNEACQPYQQLSPVGAVAMVARPWQPVKHQQKTSPNIARQIFTPRSKSLSPNTPAQAQTVLFNNDLPPGPNEGLNLSALRRFSDPKFWQNTLQSITHQYVSPFNFHRLPHAILASSQQRVSTANTLAFQAACASLSPQTQTPGFGGSYAMIPQALLHSAQMESRRLALHALSQQESNAGAQIPFAFAQASHNPLMFPLLRAVDSSQDRRSPKEEMRDTSPSTPTKNIENSTLKLARPLASLDNNSSPNNSSPNNSSPNNTHLQAKVLPWLQDLPYHNLSGEFDPSSTERIMKRLNEPPRYQCDACKKSYATFSGLSKHKQFHCECHIKKEFSCKYCEKTYNSLGALKMHIRTHTLPCKCQICGKAFSRPWLLQGHLRTHTGEKPFFCPECGRAFADRSNLRAHLQTHSDIKKYSCTECSKTFSRMSLLVKHKEGSCPGLRNNALQTMITNGV